MIRTPRAWLCAPAPPLLELCACLRRGVICVRNHGVLGCESLPCFRLSTPFPEPRQKWRFSEQQQPRCALLNGSEWITSTKLVLEILVRVAAHSEANLAKFWRDTVLLLG
jgi:hypothetical protein